MPLLARCTTLQCRRTSNRIGQWSATFCRSPGSCGGRSNDRSTLKPARCSTRSCRPLQTLSYRHGYGGCTTLTGRSLEPDLERRRSHRRTRPYDPARPLDQLQIKGTPRCQSGHSENGFEQMLRTPAGRQRAQCSCGDSRNTHRVRPCRFLSIGRSMATTPSGLPLIGS